MARGKFLEQFLTSGPTDATYAMEARDVTGQFTFISRQGQILGLRRNTHGLVIDPTSGCIRTEPSFRPIQPVFRVCGERSLLRIQRRCLAFPARGHTLTLPDSVVRSQVLPDRLTFCQYVLVQNMIWMKDFQSTVSSAGGVIAKPQSILKSPSPTMIVRGINVSTNTISSVLATTFAQTRSKAVEADTAGKGHPPHGASRSGCSRE